jgi:hypothetical protein
MQTFSYINETEVEAAKMAASTLGYKIHYKNRNGRQYITLFKIDKTQLDYNVVSAIVKGLFPSALVTSYGLTATFRINP